jgi:uncharacterized protein (DUF1800 family)
MTDASIALNRFGLGARPGEDAGNDPRKWLAAQIAAFDPRPQAIASQVPSSQVARALGDFYERQRLLRQENPKPKAQPGLPAKPAVPSRRWPKAGQCRTCRVRRRCRTA